MKKWTVNLPDPPEGIEYRGMGTMEANIWAELARRLKSIRESWSEDGANNLSNILIKKVTGVIYELLINFIAM